MLRIEDMDALTASLERSLQKITLNDNISSSSSSSSNCSGGYVAAAAAAAGGNFLPADDDVELLNDDSPLDLHSEMPLPPFWEQCLDLKTGELYYINWRTGLKYREDPRINPEMISDSYSEEDSCSYDDSEEGSSSESSSYQTVEERLPWQYNKNIGLEIKPKKYGEGGGSSNGQVLVVAGCKSCLMYFMVPKQENDCPKCYGHLLHF